MTVKDSQSMTSSRTFQPRKLAEALLQCDHKLIKYVI